jgi:hypothetical protein
MVSILGKLELGRLCMMIGVGWGDFEAISICQVLLLCEIISMEVRFGSLLL